MWAANPAGAPWGIADAGLEAGVLGGGDLILPPAAEFEGACAPAEGGGVFGGEGAGPGRIVSVAAGFGPGAAESGVGGRVAAAEGSGCPGASWGAGVTGLVAGRFALAASANASALAWARNHALCARWSARRLAWRSASDMARAPIGGLPIMLNSYHETSRIGAFFRFWRGLASSFFIQAENF